MRNRRQVQQVGNWAGIRQISKFIVWDWSRFKLEYEERGTSYTMIPATVRFHVSPLDC